MLKAFFCAAILLFAGLLMLPFVIRLHIDRTTSILRLRLDSAFSWGLIGFGLSWQESQRYFHPLFLGRHLLSFQLSAAPPSPSQAPRKTASAGERKPPSTPGSLDWVRWLGGPGLELLAAVPRTISLRRLRLSGHFGLDDPARTGRLFGYLQGLRYTGQNRLCLDLFPDFTRSGFQGQVDLVAHLRLGLLLLLILRFGCRSIIRWFAGRAWGY